MAAIVVAAYAPQIAGALFGTTNAVAIGAVGGFSAGLVGSGGDLRAAIMGGITGTAFGWASGVGDPTSFGRYAAHAFAGCRGAVVGGGSCGRGAMSAFVGKYVTNSTTSWNNISRFMAVSVAGGTASVIGSGRFGNGAQTAAFGYLFNELVEQSRYIEGSQKLTRDTYSEVIGQSEEPTSMGIFDAAEDYVFGGYGSPTKFESYSNKALQAQGAEFFVKAFTDEWVSIRVVRTYDTMQNYRNYSYQVSNSILDTDTNITIYLNTDEIKIKQPVGYSYKGRKTETTYSRPIVGIGVN